MLDHEEQVGSFIVQRFPEKDEAAQQALNDFYREPLERRKRNELWKEVTQMAFDAIDTTELDELLASSRERGVYEREARLFIEGGEQAGKVNLENGTFKGKSAATVAAGFRGTVSKNFADTLRVISNDNGVYLVNTSL